MKKRNNPGLWVIAFFVFMIFCFAVANAAYDGLTDGQIKLQNNVNTAFDDGNTALLFLSLVTINPDTVNVIEVFTCADTATFTVSCDATFALDVSVGDSLYVGDDLCVVDSVYIGGNLGVAGAINPGSILTPYNHIYIVDAEGGGDYETIQEALDVINADGVTEAGLSTFENAKYLLKICPGDYTENLTINNVKYLRIEMAGVRIIGTVTLTTTQQTADYYSKIEFCGGMSNRPEKGDNAEITGNITGTRNNDSLIYLSFTGIELSGNMGFTENGTWTIFMNHCYMSNSSGYFYGDFSGAGSPSVLLESMGLTRFKAHIANTDNSTTEVSLYDVIDTEFDLIDITPAFGGTVRNCEFKSDVTISSGTYEFDNFSYGEAVRQTEDFTGATITYMDNYNGGDVTIVGDATVDSLYANGNIVSADSVIVTNTVSAEHIYSSDDGAITDDFSVGGETTLSGGVTFNMTTVEDSVYTVLVSDYIINISHTDTDTVDVTIPTALIGTGKTFQIWDTEFNADTNYITINTEGAELINEAAADTISTAGGKRWIWSDGTNWFSRE